MEKIIRKIIRNREGREVTHEFTTYDFIFNPVKDPMLEKIRAFLLNGFQNGLPTLSISPSQMPELILDVRKAPSDCDLYMEMAKKADYHERWFAQHRAVQEYLLRYHPHCVATEVPVFNLKDDRAGLMDFLIYIPELQEVHIPDFKPKAANEKKAATQLYWYKNDFCGQTQISRDRVRIMYFDDKNCYEVKC